MPATRRRSAKSVTSTAERMSKAIDTTSTTVKVAKYSKPIEIKKVTETPTKTRRFATTRPDEPKISLEEYVSDFKIRMQINNYEVMEFFEDVKKFYNTTSPHVVKFYTYVKDQVQSLSNTETTEDNKEES